MGCPFHSHSGGVALGDIPGIVRCTDRVRLMAAIDQLEASIVRTDDLDEARGVALTFVAMVLSASLEMGGQRSLHRVQLDLARELDDVATSKAIATTVRAAVERIATHLFDIAEQPPRAMIERALRFMNRHYMEDLTDDVVARELGLSTSHFRHLFREATGQPFHRYLMALRLEHARRLLSEEQMSVSDVAISVGFTGLAHFSRAFASRFQVSPSSLRRGSRALAESRA